MGFVDKLIEKFIAMYLQRVLGGKATTVAGIISATGIYLTSFTSTVPDHYKPTVIGVSAMLAAVAGMMGYGPKGNSNVLKAFLFTVLLWSSCANAQEVTKSPITIPAQISVPVETVTNLYAAGGSYSVNASPSVAGSALYAHLVAGSGTYAFTHIDALPNTIKPFTVTSNIGVGIAQNTFTFKSVPVFCQIASGFSWTGTNTGWQYNSGCLAAVKVKSSYYVIPTLRFLKSSVSNGTGYQPIIGLMFGWGN